MIAKMNGSVKWKNRVTRATRKTRLYLKWARRRNVSVNSVLYFDSINFIKLIIVIGIKLFFISLF